MTSKNPKYLYDLSVFLDKDGINNISFVIAESPQKFLIRREHIRLKPDNSYGYKIDTPNRTKKIETTMPESDVFIDLFEFLRKKENTDKITSLTIYDPSLVNLNMESGIAYLKERLINRVGNRYFSENELNYVLHGKKTATLTELTRQEGASPNYEVLFEINGNQLDKINVIARNNEKGWTEFNCKFLDKNAFSFLKCRHSGNEDGPVISYDKNPSNETYLEFTQFFSKIDIENCIDLRMMKDGKESNLNPMYGDHYLNIAKNEIAKIASSYGYEKDEIKNILKGIPSTNVKMSGSNSISPDEKQRA